MKKKHIVIGAVVFVVLAAAAVFYFLFAGGSGATALASVNGEKITVARFLQEVEKLEEPSRSMVKENPAEFLDMIKKEQEGKLEVLVIDVNKIQNLAVQYQIQVIPTLVFFDSKGKEMFRHQGFKPKTALMEELKKIG